MSEIIASGTDRTEEPDAFAYVVDWKAEQYCMHFSAYMIMSMPLAGRPGGPSFRKKGSDSMGDWTENIAEAQPDIEGWIKWDGCSDITFRDSHFCGAHSFIQHIRLMAWIVNKAASVIPGWSEDGDTIKLDVSVVRGRP